MAKNTAAATADDDHHHEVHESAMDYAEHRRSYQIFLGLLKWSIIGIAVLVVILYFLIQP